MSLVKCIARNVAVLFEEQAFNIYEVDSNIYFISIDEYAEKEHKIIGFNNKMFKDFRSIVIAGPIIHSLLSEIFVMPKVRKARQQTADSFPMPTISDLEANFFYKSPVKEISYTTNKNLARVTCVGDVLVFNLKDVEPLLKLL